MKMRRGNMDNYNESIHEPNRQRTQRRESVRHEPFDKSAYTNLREEMHKHGRQYSMLSAQRLY